MRGELLAERLILLHWRLAVVAIIAILLRRLAPVEATHSASTSASSAARTVSGLPVDAPATAEVGRSAAMLPHLPMSAATPATTSSTSKVHHRRTATVVEAARNEINMIELVKPLLVRQ